ncbi:GNAT family N-acetyltransferase [Aquimarina sp. AU474]|uniref:GNAT family N-acetyltransferase n=1 Tax=Aquimarina sp. AU474 TaxID=2108529 RepID=UPI000D68B5D7|nr:GNAT family N-acetyltransferase [Aquimarina sp. AU474]
MIEIRRATIDDAKHISYLGAITFDQSFGHLFHDSEGLKHYLDTTFDLEKIQNSLVKSDNLYWLAVENNLPVGYGKLQLNAPSEFVEGTNVCKLQKIYFLNSHVGKGIGGRLQQLIFDEAKTNSCDYLWLSALKENKEAVKFYERNNYYIAGEHLFVIGKQKFDFWVMSKKLDAAKTENT